MRTSILFPLIVAAGFGFAMISCSSDSSKAGQPAPIAVQMDTLLIDGFPLDSAKAATARFRRFSQLGLGGTPLKAFTVRGADLMEALDLDSLIPTNPKQREAFIDTTAIRVYMGIDSIRDTSKKGYHYDFKLFVVNVNKSSYTKNIPGHDVFFSSKQVKAPKMGGANDYVLDFNAPCPTLCPDDSPLNN